MKTDFLNSLSKSVKSLRQVSHNYGLLIRHAGWVPFLRVQLLGVLEGCLNVLSISCFYGTLLLFVTGSDVTLREKLSEYHFYQWLPDRIKEHLFFSFVAGSFIFLIFRLFISAFYAHYAALQLELFAESTRIYIIKKYFDDYGKTLKHTPPSDILHFSHQLTRFVSYYANLFKANLDAYNALFILPILLSVSVSLSVELSAVLIIVFLGMSPLQRLSKTTGDHAIKLVRSIEKSLGQFLHGIEVLKTYGGETTRIEELKKLNAEYVKYSVKSDVIERVNFTLPEFTVLILICLLLSIRGVTGDPVMVGFLVGILRLFSSLNSCNNYLNRAARNATAPDEIFNFLHQHPDSGRPQTGVALVKIDRLDHVEFKNIQVCSEHKTLLELESFSLSRGDKIQLKGPNGSGKTTLIRILLGLCPYQGEITINKKYPLKDVDPKSLLARIAYLPQTSFLFADNIAENLKWGNSKTTGEILELCLLLGMDDFLDKLEGGLEYRVSENLKNLSGGQIQILCIARALARDADLLILDEYANHLDSKVLATVDEMIRTAVNDCALVVVSHISSTLVDQTFHFSNSTLAAAKVAR